MHAPHTRSAVSDLNLLRVFAALMEERSVTRAGERLALSQSAVSHALSRLRDVLGDELFVRSAAGMNPTPRAREIAPGIARGLAQLQAALEPRAFEPAASRRRFQIAASPYLTLVLLPEVVRQLRREAPGASLGLRHGLAGVADALDSGRVDLALGSFEHVPERLEAETVLTERRVWAACADNAAAAAASSAAEMAALPRLVIASEEPDETLGGRVFDHDLERRVVWDYPAGDRPGAPPVVTAPDAPSAVALLPGTDLAGVVPLRLAAPAARAGRLRIVGPEPPSPPAVIGMIWRRDRSSDPALAWLRERVKRAGEALARDLGG